MAKRAVTYNGRTYKVRSDSIEIPDLASMGDFEALVWINRHTYRRGYHAAPSPLTGMGGAINLRVG